MQNPHTLTIKRLENRAKKAFALFSAASVTSAAPPQVASPNPRARLVMALKTAVENPAAEFEAAATLLRREVDGCVAEWVELQAAARGWLDVAAALRGDDVELHDLALAAAVETLKQSPQAASLAREIETAIEPLLQTLQTSAEKHGKSMRNAMRHAVHRTGFKLYTALGNTRKAQTHDLLLQRAAREAAQHRRELQFVRAGGTAR